MGRVYGHLSETGNKRASPITGSATVRFYGLRSGRRSKLQWDAVGKRNADTHIMKHLIANAAVRCKALELAQALIHPMTPKSWALKNDREI